MNSKVVVITGASSGIGLALTKQFALENAKIVIAARSIEKLEEIKKELEGKNIEVLAVKADVSIEDDCKSMIKQAVERFGGIDILINNAGISMRAIFEDVDLSVIHKLMDTNFWGTVYSTKYALPYILKSKGSVVGVSSIAGYVGLPARTGYSASKFAMQGFLEVLRTENLKKGLHVLIACPGFTASNIRNTALVKDGSQQGDSPRDEGKMMSSEEVAKSIVKAIKKRKPTLILTLEGKLVVLFKKFVPTLLTKMVYNSMAKEADSPLK
ncbi:MAG: SDR family oxidoreductase [Bacteroidota bacterium]